MMNRNKFQRVWVSLNSLITHFLCFEVIREKCWGAWFYVYYLVAHSRVHGTYFTMSKKIFRSIILNNNSVIFIYSFKPRQESNFMVLRFHNPHFHDLLHRHDLMYELPLKQAQDNDRGYTLKNSLGKSSDL